MLGTDNRISAAVCVVLQKLDKVNKSQQLITMATEADNEPKVEQLPEEVREGVRVL